MPLAAAHLHMRLRTHTHTSSHLSPYKSSVTLRHLRCATLVWQTCAAGRTQGWLVCGDAKTRRRHQENGTRYKHVFSTSGDLDGYWNSLPAIRHLTKQLGHLPSSLRPCVGCSCGCFVASVQLLLCLPAKRAGQSHIPHLLSQPLRLTRPPTCMGNLC